MGIPVWVTPAGDLGKIQEAEFYDFQVIVEDPEAPSDELQPRFNLQSGTMPTGLRITREGLMEGRPSCEIFIAGVPTNVGQNVTSRFVLRATSYDGIVSDRTFELTVVGQDDPLILTADGELGIYRDGQYVNEQIVATDADPDDTLTFRILDGELPPGVTISNDGYITGYIEPTPLLTGTPGFDANAFDVNSFDFRTIAQNKNFQFTVAVTDGKSTVAGNYTIYVYAGNTFTADNADLTADMAGFPFTTDQNSLRPPVLLTAEADIGIVTHDNYFAYQFTGMDFDGDPIEYSLGVGGGEGYDNDLGFDGEINGFDVGDLELPPGLVLDSTTGWLYGYIPNLAATQTEYTFTVRVLKANDSTYKSDFKFFTMTIVGDIRSIVNWITPEDIGTIAVGEISTISIEATNTLNKNLQYRLKSRSNSKLPQGLNLNLDGLIVGRPAFKTFMIDGGTTSFDSESFVINETTFERTYTFTVEAFDSDGDVSAFKTFTIVIDPGDFIPYENLWAKAYPKVEQRDIWSSLINSPDDFPPDLIYRQNDYYYGKQQDIRIILSTGLNPSLPAEMISAIAKNHYNKRVAFGEIKKARAVRDGVVQYEVVYLDVLDTEANSLKQSTGLSIDFYENHNDIWSNPALVSDTNLTGDYDGIDAGDSDQHVFYPNSFENMNQQLLDNVGQLALTSLPLWMRSKQENGSILGFTPAVVIAYVTPGSADEIIFNIKRRTDIDLKDIEFIIDRYIWDNDMTVNFDIANDEWGTETETTFDLSVNAADETFFDGGSTRFITDSFLYKSSRDDGDSFLKFPLTNIDSKILG